jgi:hypothetical protein
MENQHQNLIREQEQNPVQNSNRTPDYGIVKNRSVVSVSDWIITFILLAIPVVNIIMLFVWAFGNDAPESKANWAKACLVLYLVAVILVVCLWGTLAAIFVSILNS